MIYFYDVLFSAVRFLMTETEEQFEGPEVFQELGGALSDVIRIILDVKLNNTEKHLFALEASNFWKEIGKQLSIEQFLQLSGKCTKRRIIGIRF